MIVIIERDSLNSVCNTRAYHSADRDTDTINTRKTAYQDKNREFVERLEASLATSQEQSAEDRWSCLRNTKYSPAVSVYGKKERKNADWFEANITELEPVINGKRTSLVNYKRNTTPRNLQALRAARRKAQKHQRHVRRHQTGQWKSNKEDGTFEIQNMRGDLRPAQADGKMGRALPRPLLWRKLSLSESIRDN